MGRKKFYVTGGTGYIGSLLVERLDASPYKIRGQESWKEIVEKADVIFHLAAQTSFAESNIGPLRDWEVNVLPILHLAKACQDLKKRPHVVFASTATVVGLPKEQPVTEETVCHPVNVYDIHKLTAEYYLQFFAKTQKLFSAVSLRLSSVYGPSRVASVADRGILNRMVRKALAGQDLPIYGFGQWVRDYVHIDDVVSAFVLAGRLNGEYALGNTYNVCSGVGIRFCDAIGMIAEIANRFTGRQSKAVHVLTDKLSPIDERNYVGSNDLFRAATGWKPTVDFSDGVLALLYGMRESL